MTETTEAPAALRVDVWSDVVCPWCAIGKANLEQALAGVPGGDEAEVVWHSYELDPGAPAEPARDLVGSLAAKYGVPEGQARQMIERVRQAGAAAGLDLRQDIARPGNTFDAHRLLHLARARGRQAEVADRFLRAYHSEGVAISDRAELERLAVDAGLDRDEVVEVLTSDAYGVAVRDDEADARRIGVTGVPFFVFDGRYALSGAQPPEVMREVIERTRTEAGTGPA